MKKDYYVQVCSDCRKHLCWHGEWMCETSRTANIKRVKASSLEKPPTIERLMLVVGSVEYV